MKTFFILSCFAIFLLIASNSISQTNNEKKSVIPDSLYLLKLEDDSEIFAVSIDSTSNIRYNITKPDSSHATVAKTFVKSIKKVEKPFEPPKPQKKSKKPKSSAKDSLLKEYHTKKSSTPDSIKVIARDEIELGINLGTPAGINAFGGYAGKYLITHISGMDIGTVKGIQFDFGYPLYKSYKGYSALGLAVGSSKFALRDLSSESKSAKVTTYDYVGLVYMFSYKTLFGQFGLAYGEGMQSKFQLVLQIGLRARITL